jgi:TolB protein
MFVSSAHGTASRAPLLAFSRCGPDGCANGTDLWVIREDGTGLRRVTRQGTHNEFPSWSPDGRQLAFARSDGLSGGIWTLDVTTSKVRRLTQGAALDAQPAWSPDGRTIAFVRQVHGEGSAIETISADGRHLSRLTSIPGNYQHPTWSPDGRQIAFAYSRNPHADHYGISIIEANGVGRRELARDRAHDYLDPAWSPDGKEIAFSLLGPRGKTFSADLEVMKPDGSDRRLVARASPSTVYFSPSWAPDGQALAFVSLSPRTNQGQGLLAFVKLSGSNLHVLTTIRSDNRSPVWQPRHRL